MNILKELSKNFVNDIKSCCSNIGDMFFFSFILLMSVVLFTMLVGISVLIVIGMI